MAEENRKIIAALLALTGCECDEAAHAECGWAGSIHCAYEHPLTAEESAALRAHWDTATGRDTAGEGATDGAT